MSNTAQVLAAHGGIARVSTLRSHGVSPAELRALLGAGLLLRPRLGWYALPGTPDEVLKAVAVGGQLTCISALRLREVWCVDDHRLHVHVPSNAGRLNRRGRLVVHYGRMPGVARHPVADIVHALAQTFTCQSKENVLVALNSALNKGLITSEQLGEIKALVPSRYHPYFQQVDGRCESGLETKCVVRLRRLNIRFRVQMHINSVGRVDVLIGDRLVLELDGIAFHTGEAVKSDRRRDLALHRLGYIVLRVDYGMVMDEWDEVEAVIRGYVSRNEHRWSARHERAGLAVRL